MECTLIDDFIPPEDMVDQQCKNRDEMNKDPIEIPYLDKNGTVADGKTSVQWGDDETNNVRFSTGGYGLQQSYDGTGYVIRIPYSTTRDDYILYIKSLFDDSTFFDHNLLSVFIASLAFYIPSHDWLISISILIEFDQTGKVFPTDVDVLTLQMETTEEEGKTKQTLIFMANCLRSACCFYTLCMIYLKIKYRNVLKHIAASVVRDIL